MALQRRRCSNGPGGKQEFVRPASGEGHLEQRGQLTQRLKDGEAV